MVLGRILFPSAKLALAEQAEDTALARACGLPADKPFDADDLYEAMDLLNGQWVSLERSLYQEAFRMVLYDLLIRQYEGACDCGGIANGIGQPNETNSICLIAGLVT